MYEENIITDKEVKQFYNSKEWKRKRAKILERDHHECRDCRNRIADAYMNGITLTKSEAKIRRGCEVHHIKELREYPNLALNNDNLISLCTQCHNVRHGRNPKRFVRKKKLLTAERW